MKIRGAVAMAFGLVLTGSSALLAQTQSMIDQEQPAINNSGNTLVIGGTSSQMLAQTFTASRSGTLTYVSMPIACSPAATIVVEIHDVTRDGMPGIAVLASETISGSIYPGYIWPYSTSPAAGLRLVEFKPAARVKAGVQYSIVLTAMGDSCSILPSIDGDWYSGGHGYFEAKPDAPGWSLLFPGSPYDDFPFQTFVLVRHTG
jgi:hypothetical protein